LWTDLSSNLGSDTGHRSTCLHPASELHADLEDLAWVVGRVARAQPKRVTEVDRIPAGVPVGIEPARDANGVSLRDKAP